MAETPLLTAKRDSTIRIRLKNDTSFPHGMHLHGHHFRQILERSDSLSPRMGPWRDTLLVYRGESVDIVFIADNPGKWLLHCHMLGHQAAGMKTWIQVT
jgi:FtsP/CotA-like multicopper oxidase with cupredoxin domain